MKRSGSELRAKAEREKQWERDQLLFVATAMARGLLADPRMDWSSNKLAQYAVIYARDLIHEVKTTDP